MSFEYKGAFAALPTTERGRSLNLGADPKGKNFLYCNGNSVFIRDIENPAIVDIYTQHTQQTTVAKYAPSGFYIASADVSGKLRIWDTVNKEHILKNEFSPFSGLVRDICWSPDSKRIIVVGEGREKFGVPIMMDTGTTVGTISNHMKTINSVDFKPTRPYRAVTASDDMKVVFHEGPPFKVKLTLKDHNKFVQTTRFSPDGACFMTGASDGKVFIYDGKTADKKGSLGGDSNAHKGSVFGLCFSPDGKQVLTCSGDKTAKIWDVETSQTVLTFEMGNDMLDMQQGCLWIGENLLTVSLSGVINYLDKNNPTTPLRILKGHTTNITAMALSEDKSNIFTASHDGRTCFWNVDTGVSGDVEGEGHGTMVCAFDCAGDQLASVGYDDQVKFINQDTKKFETSSSATDSQPRDISCGKDGLVAVAADDTVIIYRNGNRVFLQKENYDCKAISIHPGQTDIAVGGSDNKVHLYSLDGDNLRQVNQLTVRGEVTALQYSPDGASLISGDSLGVVNGWAVGEEYKPSSHIWTYHSARIQSIAWAPDSVHFATCALDSQIFIWGINDFKYVVQIKGAHQGSNITQVGWVDNNTLVSAGYDKSIRKWSITYP